MEKTMKWYVVHTYSGYEEKAKQALLDRIKIGGRAEMFGEVFVPRVAAERVTKGGKKKKIEKTSYPGYILVQMHLDDHTRQLVKDTPKVTGFVGNAKDPRPISDQEALRLTSPEAIEANKQIKTVVAFEKNESVKVIDGPFSNFDGVVEEVKPDKMKLKILVSIFGRETPVELDFSQVKKLT